MFGFLKKSPAPNPTATDPAVAETVATSAAASWRQRLKSGLARTRAQFGGKLKTLFSRGKVDDELLEELEALLLTSDVGLDATEHLLYQLKMRAKRDKIDTPEAIQRALSETMYDLLLPLEEALDLSSHRPFIIMIAGVNGAGKTTSIGKLAKHFQAQGRSVPVSYTHLDVYKRQSLRRVIRAMKNEHIRSPQRAHRLWGRLPAVGMRRVHRRPEGPAGNRIGTRQRLFESSQRARLLAVENLGRELRTGQYLSLIHILPESGLVHLGSRRPGDRRRLASPIRLPAALA